MLSVDKSGDDFLITAIGRSPFVYLDTCALIVLAQNENLQHRFLKALFEKGGTLLISLANIIELGRKEGDSLNKLQLFFEKLGANWFPLEVNPLLVIERETSGKDSPPPNIDENLITAYYPHIHDQSHSLAKVIELIRGNRKHYDAMFSRAGDFADETSNVRKHFHAGHPAINPGGYLVTQFNPQIPTHYTYNGLMRAVMEGHFKFTANDVVDIWHAATSIVYGDLVVLDRRWVQIAKDKLKLLPGLKQKLFKVTDLESMIETLAHALVV